MGKIQVDFQSCREWTSHRTQRRSNTPELQTRLPDLHDNNNITIDDSGMTWVTLQKNTKEPP